MYAERLLSSLGASYARPQPPRRRQEATNWGRVELGPARCNFAAAGLASAWYCQDPDLSAARRGEDIVFDPYHIWLGIPPDRRPPTHYELLGIRPDETNVDVINAALIRQSAYVRNFQKGKHTDDATRILNELSAANVCLTDPALRSAYDATLGKAELAVPAPRENSSRPQLGATRPVADRPQPANSGLAASPLSDPPASFDAGRQSTGNRPRRRMALWRRPAAWGAAGVVAFVVIAFGLFPLLRSSTGSAQIMLSDPQADLQVYVDGQRVRQEDLARPLSLAPGNHVLEVTGAQIESVQQTFTIARGDRAVIPVTISPLRPVPGERPTQPSVSLKPGSVGKGKGVGHEWKDNDLRMTLLWCPPGTFGMGTPRATNDESPVDVTLSRGFWLGKFEVTQGEWQQLMGTTPWQGEADVQEGSDYAACFVSWDDAVRFCETWTAVERTAGRLGSAEEFRLPTEAEWEYACRSGAATTYCFGNDDTRLGEFAWFDQNALRVGERYAHWVGQKTANGWAYHDMHGNVWEWCSDAYDSKLAGGRDPTGPSFGASRVHRGGSWHFEAGFCRSAVRRASSPGHRDFNLGFRVAMSQAH